MARPSELTLGLLAALAGFGQGFFGGKVAGQEREREEKEKAGLRREKELDREERRRVRMDEQGQQYLDRAQRTEEFKTQTGLQERGLAIQEESGKQRATESAADRVFKGRQLQLQEAGLDLERDTLEANTRLKELELSIQRARANAQSAGQPTTEQDYLLASLAELNKDPIEAYGILSKPDKLAAYMQGLRTSFRLANASGVTPPGGTKPSAVDNTGGTGGQAIGPLPGIQSPLLGREVPNVAQLMQQRIPSNPYEAILSDILDRRTAAPLDSILEEALNPRKPIGPRVQRGNEPRGYTGPVKTVK